jgi:hypothetical protein
MASKSSKQFGRTVEGGMRGKQISQEVKAPGFEVASSMERGAGGTNNSIALAERPRVSMTKAAVDDVGGADMVA